MLESNRRLLNMNNFAMSGDLVAALLPADAEALRLNGMSDSFGLEVFQQPLSGKLVVSGYATHDVTKICMLRDGSLPYIGQEILGCGYVNRTDMTEKVVVFNRVREL